MDIWRLSNSFWTRGLIQTSRTGWKCENSWNEIMKSYIRDTIWICTRQQEARGFKEFDRSNKCCLQEGGDLPGPRGPLWKNRHRSHSSRLTSRDGENSDFSPTKSCKFYHLVFLVFLSDILHITLVHPTQVGKYTAYGSMIYTHTALHLASRNGHTRCDIFLTPYYEVLCLQIQISESIPQGGWGAAASRTRHQRTNSSRNGSAWGCALWQGVW